MMRLPLSLMKFLLSGEMGLDPGVFGRFDLAALVQSPWEFLFICLFHAFSA